LLQWKCNKYYIFWVCVCVLTLVIRNEKRMRCIILSSVVCLSLPYFSTLSHKRNSPLKSVTKHKICVLIFPTALS